MSQHHSKTFCSLLLLHIVQSQYQQIWYNDMESNDGWNMINDVTLPSSSNDCFNGYCARLRANSGNSWIDKSTNITQYSSVQIQFDLNGVSLDSEDFCKIWYRYDSNSLTQIGPDFTDGTYNNYIINFSPPSITTTNIFIRLEIHGNSDDGGDRCYFDNVYLRGILKTPSPTSHPSTNPSHTPTKYPTILPTILTRSPTKYPTILPTLYPTILPTILTRSPTKNPTKYPTTFPTNYPTTYPTKYPSKYPTKYPTKEPSEQPTTHPTEPESEIQSNTLVTTKAMMDDGKNVKHKSVNFFDNTEIVVILILIAAFCCVGCLIFLICLKQKRYKNELYRLQSKIDEIQAKEGNSLNTVEIQPGVSPNKLEMTKVASMSSISDVNNEIVNDGEKNAQNNVMYQSLPHVIPNPVITPELPDTLTPTGMNTDALTKSILMCGQVTNGNNNENNNDNDDNNENEDNVEGDDAEELFSQEQSSNNETTKSY